MADSLTLKALLARLKPGETPIFRHTRDTLLSLRQRQDELSARELARVLLSDPLATLRVIYQANNRSSRSLGGEIATVEHAVLMQGVIPFLNKVAAMPVLEDTPAGKDPQVLASVYRLLRIAQHAAWQARDFCVLKADTRAEEVEVAALLYYVPDLLFWLQTPDVARQLARKRRRMDYDSAEVEVLGFPLTEFRLAMMSAWKVPEVIRDLFDPRLADRIRQSILLACLDIAHRSRRGWWQPQLAEDYLTLADADTKALEYIATTVHQNAIRAARYGAWIPSTPAAAWLVMLPGEWPPEPGDEEEETVTPAAPPAVDRRPAASAQKTPGTRTPAPVTPPSPPDGDTCPMPDLAVLRQTQDFIQSHLDGTLTLTQLSAQILRGLHTGLGLSRILFAMTTPDGERIKVRFSLGIPASDPLRHFEFALAGKDLFCLLMLKPQGVWINPENRPQLWPRVAPRLQSILCEGDFYAMSLFANNQPAGLIYADRGHGSCGLDAKTYADFKAFCLLASKGLGMLKPA